MLDTMYRHSTSTVTPNVLHSPENTSPSDSESDIVLTLEHKRREIDDEISKFRAQKDKEFRDFEKELRANKRRMNARSTNQHNGYLSSGNKTRPTRTSSSSALDLLIGHGMSKPCQTGYISPKKGGQKSNAKDTTNTITTLPSKPTLSLDPQNITGDIPHSHPHTPPTPTLLNRNISSTAVTPPPSQSPPKSRDKPSSSIINPLPTPTQERQDAFTGLFVPAYLPLLSAKAEIPFPSPSPLVTPPLESSNTIVIQQPIGTVHLPNGIVPLQSSSYPPSITVFSPTNPANKRSYTAPTVTTTRIPSALRTASGGNIGRKRKRVTFRLADSAIVEPSSSYEEGVSPQMGSASTSTSSIASSKSGLKSPGRGPRKSMLGSGMTSDQEDEEAGVKPGMNMGEVMQKLNDYSLATNDDDDEDVGHIDVKYHEDDEEEEEEDEPMAMNYDSEDDNTEQVSEADDMDNEDDGYFSPRAKHAASALDQHTNQLQVLTKEQQRPGNSPISPYRDANWDNLSSSDKDRLLFRQRASDEDESDRGRKIAIAQSKSVSENDNKSQKRGKKSSQSKSTSEASDNYTFSQAVDGGSGVGFFELDEELASPDAGVARPFDFSTAGEELEPVMSNASETDANTAFHSGKLGAGFSKADAPTGSAPSDLRGLGFGHGKHLQSTSGGLKRSSSGKGLSSMGGSWKSGFANPDGTMPVGSVPINIIKPSPSVSSSWVGTFGH